MICDKSNCTGCFSCFNICPNNAISMRKDEYGNIYPVIDNEKCIKCGLCKKVCPELKENLDFHQPITAYAMYNKDSNKRKESSSGGAVSTCAEYFLNNNGVVYGASNLFGEKEFKFIRIDNMRNLYKVKGSKYVHCYINEAFKNIKNDLLSKNVLFIGTPCQVAGLKSYLMSNYSKLTTIDFICHGVPSQQLLFDEINMHGIDTKNVNIISFRDDKQFNFKIIDEDGKILLEKPSHLIDYYNNFLQGNIYRDNCYSCKYAKRERIGDITVGDFWRIR